MGLSGYKIRQLWLPFLILAVVILAISWILAGVVNPSNVQGNDEQPVTPERSTPTDSPTATATKKIQPTVVSIAGSISTTTPTVIVEKSF